MYSTQSLCLFVICSCFIAISNEISIKELQEKLTPPVNLEPSKKLQCCSKGQPSLNRGHPRIYCFKAIEKGFNHLWTTAEVLITLNPDQYELYWGYDDVDVINHYLSEQSILKFNVFFWKENDIKLYPFNNTCFGIVTSEDYELELKVETYNKSRLWLFWAGLIMFYMAPILAPDPLFYYITGITGGVLLSFAILFYFLLSILPAKKTTVFAIMAGGGGIIYYLMDWILTILRTFIIKYQTFVMVYIAVSAVISFFICYRYGPVTNPQSINIIKWSLQGAGLVAVWFSSDYKELIQIVDGLVAILFYAPVFKASFYLLRLVLRPIYLLWVGCCKLVHVTLTPVRRVRRYFITVRPPKLLTRHEYRVQGQVETKRAMEDLQDAFRTRRINPFETLLRLSPEGRHKILALLTSREDHVSKEERREHSWNYDEEITDDED